MQIEVYEMQTTDNGLTITLEAVCDSFSSLLWDVRYYECGQFEIYIAANARNLSIFQVGKIVGRDDDKQHFGIIEAVSLETDAEDGDYLTVTGRFLMSLLSRRIIYPTLFISTTMSYGKILQSAINANCLQSDKRKIPGLTLGEISGECWDETTTLQISYENLMDWVYKICEITGGTANIRLEETAVNSGLYTMKFELSQGVDRSMMQEENPHIVFSDLYNNLLNFSYSVDTSKCANTAYVFGSGEGSERKRTLYFSGDEPTQLDRYEVYVDAKDISETQRETSDGTSTNESNSTSNDIEIDSFLSETSENAVQNKIITLKLKEFDSMFEEIKKLLEEIKNLVGTDNGNKLYGLIQADFGGLEGISGNLVKESED